MLAFSGMLTRRLNHAPPEAFGEHMDAWMVAQAERLVEEHGMVPPPWVVMNEHPMNICWRMGHGESHLMVWWEWWSMQPFTEEQKIQYFRRWPPPHCWLDFLIQAVWNIEPSDEDELIPFFKRTSELGFGSQEDYERDLDDPPGGLCMTHESLLALADGKSIGSTVFAKHQENVSAGDS